MANTDFVVRNGLVVSNVITANTSGITLNLAGNTGSSGQVLASNGSGGLYWSNVAGSDAVVTFSNTATFSGNAEFTGTMIINGVSANGGLGSAGQVLTSNGSDTYWSTVSGGGANGTSIALNANTTDTATYYFPMSNSSSGTWSNGVVSNTKLYFVPTSGTLSATVFNSLSDITYKTDIEELNGIELLNKVNPISFKWKDTGVRSYGVIAQELEQTLPELVETNDQGIKSVSYMPMIAMLIDVVKKQQKEIDKLKTLLNNQKVTE